MAGNSAEFSDRQRPARAHRIAGRYALYEGLEVKGTIRHVIAAARVPLRDGQLSVERGPGGSCSGRGGGRCATSW
ncbi:MAG: hypothetical protein EXR75_15845 [Myxococcales bacterium]|nr:hypothetical protein [Myxococcales bacterium]